MFYWTLNLFLCHQKLIRDVECYVLLFSIYIISYIVGALDLSGYQNSEGAQFEATVMPRFLTKSLSVLSRSKLASGNPSAYMTEGGEGDKHRLLCLVR